jgi:hypothetical protein
MTKPKPLTEAQKAAYKQHLKDKTFPLRVRFFAEWSLKILFCLGVLALIGYGGFYLWSLVYAKGRADRIEQKIQEKIEETERDSNPD